MRLASPLWPGDTAATAAGHEDGLRAHFRPDASPSRRCCPIGLPDLLSCGSPLPSFKDPRRRQAVQPEPILNQHPAWRFSLATTLGGLWIAWYIAMWAEPFTRTLIALTLLFGLATCVALRRANFKGSAPVLVVATVLWLALTWQAVCLAPAWPFGAASTTSHAIAGMLLARCAVHLLVLAVLFGYVLGEFYPGATGSLCFAVAMSQVVVLWPQLWAASTAPWGRASVLVDLVGLAVGLPLLVRLAYGRRHRDELAAEAAQAEALAGSVADGAALDSEALAAAPLADGWICADPAYFEFFRSRRPLRWAAIAMQLRIDLTHARSLRVIVPATIVASMGLYLHWPVLVSLGLLVLGIYTWMFYTTVRTGITAPLRFGVIGAALGHHPYRNCAWAHARCADGQVRRLVVDVPLVDELLQRDAAAIVAFLDQSGGRAGRMLAARALPRAESQPAP